MEKGWIKMQNFSRSKNKPAALVGRGVTDFVAQHRKYSEV
jgi:hypothetical protein